MNQPGPARARWRMSRRGFLIGVGGAGALLVGGSLVLDRLRPQAADYVLKRGPGAQNFPATPDLWFEVPLKGQVILYAPKVEMGQGIHTALAQIAAEELEVEVDQLDVRQADTSHGFDGALLLTFASSSVNAVFTPLRQAAATLREMLRNEAAKQLGVPLESVIAQAGTCFDKRKPDHVLDYGTLVSTKQGDWKLPNQSPQLKDRAEFRVIGKTVGKVDMRAKVSGTATYGYDARLPNMLYGAVARPPRYGAALAHAEPGSAPQQPGVVKVVIDRTANFAGVVADTRTRARRAISQLDLRWEGGTTVNQDEIDRMVTAGGFGGAVIQRRGDVGTALHNAAVVTAEYRTPFAAHAHLEPLAALADVQADRVEIWASTQNPNLVVDGIRAVLGRERTVIVHPTLLGGGFGRKAGQSTAVEAARLSLAVGQPVHVGWTREEDLRHGFFRPPTHIVLRGALDADNHVRVIEQATASGDILWPFGEIPGGDLSRTLLGFDPGVLIGQLSHYDVPNYQVTNYQIRLPVPTGPWRGLGLVANTFALESFMDELAFSAKTDPVAFRLRHLPSTAEGQRLKKVLEAVAARAGWSSQLPPGRARGVACSFDVNTAVAQIAEVSVLDGAILIHRVTAAVDPGLVVNPQGAASQAKGSIVMGLSSTLHERLTLEDGMIRESNFSAYPLLTLRETPQIDVLLLESGDTPYGMGEPVIGPTAAAVANAVFALTGQRLRSLPLKLQTPQS
jgi:isoquinoline 1-oxidoreductase subunit beta